METRKLYYEDAYTRLFRARVMACRQTDRGWETELDATAFFPEEGGQSADTGTLGGVHVLDAQEQGGVILHLTDGPLVVGETAEGRLDWPERERKMQTHTAEHIVSGLVHTMFGYENVGFHMDPDGCTADMSGELTREQLDAVELAANRAVWDDRPVRCLFPTPEELAGMEYRSKLELTENVRIVDIEGIDKCACCAPHVASTGRIGLIRIVDSMRHRGGMRLWLKAGPDALADCLARHRAAAAISGLLNVPRADVAEGVKKLAEQRDGLKRELAAARRREAEALAASLAPAAGHILVFLPEADQDALRTVANAGMEKCGGVCAVFTGADGDWRFAMASAHVDMPAFLREHGPALQARGGGRGGMVSGTCRADRAALEAFLR